jgi:hypothetical protein
MFNLKGNQLIHEKNNISITPYYELGIELSSQNCTMSLAPNLSLQEEINGVSSGVSVKNLLAFCKK